MTSLAYAIDFGTTNSGISAIDAHGRVEVAQIPRSPAETFGLDSMSPYVHPSYLYVDDSGQRISGWPALQTYRAALSQNWARRSMQLLSSVKSYLGDPSMHGRSFSMNLNKVEMTLEEMIAVIFSDLRRIAERQFGDSPGSVRRVVLGHPVAFVGARISSRQSALERHGMALECLRNAAKLAGFDEIEFLDEANATTQAIEDLNGRCLVVDFGGGTTDFAAVEFAGHQLPAVHGIHGSPVGGSNLDGGLFDLLFSDRMGLNSSESGLPNRFRLVRTLEEFMKVLREDGFNSIVADCAHRHPELLELLAHVENPSAFLLYQSIQNAKASLSEAEEARVAYSISYGPGFPRMTPEIVVTLPDLTNVYKTFQFRSNQHAIRREIHLAADTCLQKANWSRESVRTVAINGGSSQLRPFREHMREAFPEANLSVPADSFTAVVSGLAAYAATIWAS